MRVSPSALLVEDDCARLVVEAEPLFDGIDDGLAFRHGHVGVWWRVRARAQAQGEEELRAPRPLAERHGLPETPKLGRGP